MNDTVQIHGRLVDFKELWVVQVLRVGTVASHNHLHRLLEVLNFLAQSVQVEVISDVLLVNLCEEFVTLEVAEPLNPAVSAVAVVFVVHGVFFDA